MLLSLPENKTTVEKLGTNKHSSLIPAFLK
jgi:hypothetical protein